MLMMLAFRPPGHVEWHAHNTWCQGGWSCIAATGGAADAHDAGFQAGWSCRM